jgi:hypothetical protein
MGAHRVGPVFAVGVAAFALVSSAEFHAQSSTTNPFRASVGWEKFPAGRTMGTVTGVFPDPDVRHVWILDRWGEPMCRDGSESHHEVRPQRERAPGTGSQVDCHFS